MSYSNPASTTHSLTSISFASADSTHAIKAPPGFTNGRLVDVQASVTTTCAGATTTPIVQLGITGALTKYASLALGTAAAGTNVQAATYTEADIVDTTLLITCKAATGAGAAGVASVFATIEWF